MFDKVSAATEWFMDLPFLEREEAVRELFEYAISSEWISIREGEPPYFTTTGGSLVQD